MAKTKKPTHQPSLPFPPATDALHQEGPWLWLPLRKEWRDVINKPEEIVRQKFIRTLVEHYGYALEQMDQERRTQHGHKSPRADIVVWQSVDDKAANRSPVLVAECKTDNIEIQERDYYQGELDATFDAQRDNAHADYGPRIVTGEDSATEKLLNELAALGLSRELPAWTAGEPPAYPRTCKPTQQGRPVWQGEVATNHKKTATELKRQSSAALKSVDKTIAGLFSELKAKYHAIDEAHIAALWARVRELFDYPVFVAAPKTVGITSTGETGEGVPMSCPMW